MHKEPVQRHLLIAGTGRAGTSFLVKYLTELGLDTTLSRRGASASWDENAQAGLEELPIFDDMKSLPYVLKSPWAFQFIDQLLEKSSLRLDAVVLPVRNLADAASSRITNELHKIHEDAPWMMETGQCWDIWGTTPGGAIFSLDPLDQARILALGFHKLIERLVKAEIPMVFLSFPRMITDPDYLFSQLKSILPDDLTYKLAADAHHRIADHAKVRTGQASNHHKDKIVLSPRLMKHSCLSELNSIAVHRVVEAQQRDSERLLHSIKTSRSWRITAPLRNLARFCRRVKGDR